MNEPERGTKRVVRGVLVKLLTHKVLDRNMTIESFRTRVVRPGEVHELVTTEMKEGNYQPGDRVSHVGFLGFVEISCAGVIEQGDKVWAGDQLLGTVQGFDASHFIHFHNHYNIILARLNGPASGADLGLLVEQEIRFVAAGTPDS